MLFDIIDNEECGNDRVGIFVVCALPVVTVVDESSSLVATSSSSSSSYITSGTTTANTATMMQHAHQEQIVGFCSVDGRANDPSSKLEYLTPSLLAGGVSPRPYLSDLGVVVAHRRRGIARELVSACEQWTRECGGHDKLYLKVEKKNGNAVKFYKSLGYVQTKLPWEGAYSSGGSRWDTTLLLEKSLMTVQQTQQQEGCISKAAPKRRTSWIKRSYIWRPNKTNE
jgi:ribosomal protein S18 acetylase RimI-like enzyme